MTQIALPADRRTLRLAVWPRPRLLAHLALVAGGASLIAIAAQISFRLPFTPVPITGQTFAVLLVGASYGTVLGGTSALLYVALGIAGAPVYAHGGSGWAVITSASGGYLASFPLVSALTGFFAELNWDRRFSSAVGAMLTGNTLVYLVGLPWLAVVLHTNFEKTLELGLYPFVPGDLLKVYLAAAALPAAWALVARLRR
jgi:biotin transport system substrate-specific component